MRVPVSRKAKIDALLKSFLVRNVSGVWFLKIDDIRYAPLPRYKYKYLDDLLGVDFSPLPPLEEGDK